MRRYLMDNENLIQEAQAMKDELITMRRHFHQHPELGLDTKETADYVEKKLTEYGYAPKRIGHNSVTTTIGNGGKVLLLRADMDSLPITEESGLPFASEVPGKAHCCGHDLHTAMLLGAAKLLKAHESELKGTVKLFFQAGEENMQGCRDAIEAGILQDPKVNAAMAIHVNSIAMCGRILVLLGSTASSDLFTIHIKGHGCHGARPEEGVDVLNVASHIDIALQELQAREIRAGQTGVLTVCCIQGGMTFNVFPDEAKMMGTIRTFDTQIRDHLVNRLQEIADGVAKTFRAKVTVEFEKSYTIPLVVDQTMAKEAIADLRKLFPQDQVFPLQQNFPGSEDFSFIAKEVPSIFIALGANAVPGTKFGQHHPKVIFNEDCLPVGAAVHTQFALEWLKAHKD